MPGFVPIISLFILLAASVRASSSRSHLDKLRDDLGRELTRSDLSRCAEQNTELISILSQLSSMFVDERHATFQTDLEANLDQDEHAVVRIAAYLHDVLDLAVSLSWRPEPVAVVFGHDAVRFVMAVLARAPAPVRNRTEHGTSFLHRLVSVRELPVIDDVVRLIRSMPMDVVSCSDPFTGDQTALAIALRLASNFRTSHLHRALLDAMDPHLIAKTWRSSLASGCHYRVWVQLFARYNAVLLELVQYDLGQFLAELSPPSAGVRDAIVRALWIQTLWADIRSQQTLAPFVFVSHRHDPDLLQHYEASTGDDLLAVFAPSIVGDQTLLRFVHDSRIAAAFESVRDRDQLIINQLQGTVSVFNCALRELTDRRTAAANCSPAFVRFARDLSVLDLRQSVVTVPLPTLSTHLPFVMDVVGGLLPDAADFQQLTLSQQLRRMIDHIPMNAISCNVVTLAAGLIKEMAVQKPELCFFLLYRLLANWNALAFQHHQMMVKDALDKVLEQFQDRGRLGEIYVRMLGLLLNNDFVMGRATTSSQRRVPAGSSPEPISDANRAMIRSLITRIDSDRDLASAYLCCPSSPHLQTLFADEWPLFDHHLPHCRVMLAIDSAPNTLIAVANAQDLDAQRPSPCRICSTSLSCCTDRALLPASPSRTLKLIACGHLFHRNCLRHYLERYPQCPTCQTALGIETFRWPVAHGTLDPIKLVAAISRKRSHDQMS